MWLSWLARSLLWLTPMLLDPLPPVPPEAPTSAARAPERIPEAEDESFAEHLPDEIEETEAPRPQATKPQDALVNWAALLPTAATQAQPQPTIDAAAAPAENVAAVTPIAATPTDFEAPQVVPTTPAPETTAAPATAAPEALPQSAAATSEPVTDPVRAETSAPTATQATATPADAAPTVDSEQKTATPTDAAPQSIQTAQPTQTAEPEAAPEPDQPAVQPQQAPPPALALFTAPQPVAQRPDHGLQRGGEQDRDE